MFCFLFLLFRSCHAPPNPKQVLCRCCIFACWVLAQEEGRKVLFHLGVSLKDAPRSSKKSCKGELGKRVVGKAELCLYRAKRRLVRG